MDLEVLLLALGVVRKGNNGVLEVIEFIFQPVLVDSQLTIGVASGQILGHHAVGLHVDGV